MPQDWLVNAAYNEKECSEKFENNANNQLGLNQTFDYTAILFYLIGMVFGQSYSLNYVKPLLWVHTPWHKKILRTILGIGICAGVYWVFWYFAITTTNEPTKFTFVFAVPFLLLSFFTYGFFPIICQKIGLV